jgi:hypothetical protein
LSVLVLLMRTIKGVGVYLDRCGGVVLEVLGEGARVRADETRHMHTERGTDQEGGSDTITPRAQKSI